MCDHYSTILTFSGEHSSKPKFENQIVRYLVMLVLFAVAINRILTLGKG